MTFRPQPPIDPRIPNRIPAAVSPMRCCLVEAERAPRAAPRLELSLDDDRWLRVQIIEPHASMSIRLSEAEVDWLVDLFVRQRDRLRRGDVQTTSMTISAPVDSGLFRLEVVVASDHVRLRVRAPACVLGRMPGGAQCSICLGIDDLAWVIGHAARPRGSEVLGQGGSP